MDTDRVVRVPPARLRRWLDGFAERHGDVEATLRSDAVALAADDGAEVVLA